VNKRLVAVAGAVLIAGALAAFFFLKPRVGQALPPSVADLLPVHTAVKVQDQDLRGPRRLVLGDVVETDEAGRARLRLDDGTAYVVDRNTRFAIGKNGVELERGRLFMQGASGVRSELVLGSASVILSGSNAGVERGAGGGAKVYAATDELTVRAKSGEHKVRVGESAAIQGDAVRVAPERAFSDWTGGLSAPWGVDGPPRTAIGELWGRSRNNPGDAGSALTLRAHEVRATVEGESAKTTVRSTFFNGGSATVMGDFRLAIPANAIVSRFAWGGGEKLEEAAIALAAREPGGPQPNLAVLEWAGEGWLRGFLPEIHSGASVHIEVEYVEWLTPKPRGNQSVVVEYRYPLAAAATPPLVGEFLAEIDATPAGPISIAAGYGARAEGNVVKVRRSDFRPSADLVVEVELPRFKAPVRLYAAEPATGDDGGKTVFVRTEAPEAQAGEGVTLALVVDTSGSAEASAIDASRAFVDAVLAALGPKDKVVALAADQTVRPLGPAAPGALDTARKKAIQDALRAVKPGGATDLGRALEAAADALLRGDASGLVVYVGDGWSTVGDTTIEAIKARLARRAAGTPRISAVAVGPTANRGALSALTRGAGPLLEIADSTDAAEAAIELVSKTLKPTLAGMEIDLGSGVERVYPRFARAAIAGDTLSAVGRARGALPEEVVVRWRGPEGLREERRKVVPVRTRTPDDVLRRWASARVEEFVLGGGGREIATEVALSASLLTPWTGLRIGGGTYVPSALGTRVLDLSPASLTSVLGAPSGQLGALNALPLELDQTEEDSQALLDQALNRAAARVVHDALPEVRTCRDSRAALRPELSGALSLALSLDGEGRASDVAVRGTTSDADDAALNRCVQVVVQGLRYPAIGGKTKIRVDVTLQLPPPPSLRARKCSSTSTVALPLRRGLWRERFAAGAPLANVYLDAKRACELPGWSDRRALLELMLDHQPDSLQRVTLARELEANGEREAAALVRRETVRRAGSPEELRQVQQALAGDETYPVGTFKKRYRAAHTDQERLKVVQQFLTLAPHDATLERRLLSLLHALGARAALVQEIRRIESDPFSDAALLADAASLLRQSGDEVEARRIFGQLVERAPADPWVRAFVGDRLRNEGWFDDATRVFTVLDELVPDHPASLIRLALAHYGAGRIDIARRLLARIAQTGGRAGDAQLGKMAGGLSAIVLAETLKSSRLEKEQADQLTRAGLEILATAEGRRPSVVLVRAPAATMPIKVALVRGRERARTERLPDVVAASIGLYLFLLEPEDHVQSVFRLSRPEGLSPAPELRVRIDGVREPASAPKSLLTKEVLLPLDGRSVEVRWGAP
jgi:Flp pilus assembly protein TadD